MSPSNMNLIFSSLIITISFWGGANAWKGFRIGLQWPPGNCDIWTLECNKISLVNTFTINNLRLYNNWTPVSKCTGSTFDVSSVWDFRTELHFAWPTLDSKNYRSSIDLWAQEWNDYGRCTESFLNQTDYFRSSLALRKTFDILGLLEKEGIHPMDAFYPTTRILEAIRKNLNKTPELSCRKNSQQEVVLHQIYLCINSNLTEFVDCPFPTRDCKEHDTKFVSLASQLVKPSRSYASSNGNVLINATSNGDVLIK